MQFKDIYKFEVCFIDEQGLSDKSIVYSDKKDIYSLIDLPETTFYIDVNHLINSSIMVHTCGYLVGTPLEFEELDKEIKFTTDKIYLKELEAWRDLIKKDNGENWVIFRKNGKLVFLKKNEYTDVLLVGDVTCGRILKTEITFEQNTEPKEKDDSNYIELE